MKTKDRENIPVHFWGLRKAGVKKYPRARNVGELRALLSELPDELPIDTDFHYLIVLEHVPAGVIKLHFDEYPC